MFPNSFYLIKCSLLYLTMEINAVCSGCVLFLLDTVARPAPCDVQQVGGYLNIKKYTPKDLRLFFEKLKI